MVLSDVRPKRLMLSKHSRMRIVMPGAAQPEKVDFFFVVFPFTRDLLDLHGMSQCCRERLKQLYVKINSKRLFVSFSTR